ncbi:LDL receptor domain-containing protein [Endozoicomonas sp. SESOKO1]|uniref:LDL receptor domain-containing protein n=1 Tax=Endozoicomonas sp. SESOKO1 TaxID=2828742 RepID=UPI0021490765|nr:LDL receptor domain-containing protein [Endozoicomonas sp. SESOKO1]
MQITTSTLPNTFPSQVTSSHSRENTKTSGIAVSHEQRDASCRHSPTQKPEHKVISDYSVKQLADSALQAGTGLMRGAAGFAFNQVMASPYIDGVAPGLKTLLRLAVFYHQLQPAGAACAPDRFNCANEECIPIDYSCNGHDDCGDNSDERADLCTQDKCEELGRFYCDNKKCIDLRWACDGVYDCDDNSDEGGDFCTQDKCEELKRDFQCDNRCISRNFVCDGDINCFDHSDDRADLCTRDKCEELGRDFLCGDSTRCIPRHFVCDGDIDCSDNSDDRADLCTRDRCEELGRDFLCGNSTCLPRAKLCDGYIDCSDNSDERADLCTRDRCEELGRDFQCDNSKCIPRNWLCDGHKDCFDLSDERAELCDTDSSVYAWFALPAVLTAGAIYGICTYASYKTLRQANPDSSTTPLLLNALRHPLQFRQPHQPAATAETSTSSGRVNNPVELLELQNL